MKRKTTYNYLQGAQAAENVLLTAHTSPLTQAVGLATLTPSTLERYRKPLPERAAAANGDLEGRLFVKGILYHGIH